MQPVAIINYGMGNLLSVQKALAKLGYPAVITSAPEVVAAAPGVILPGVGAFADAMTDLRRQGMVEAIGHANSRGVPILGICLGLQLLFSTSSEGGEVAGLNLLAGEVKRLPEGLKVPQIGWNQLHYRQGSDLFREIPQNTNFYFVHSYYVVPEEETIITGVVEYGINFTAAIQKGNLMGLQFHPEKSSRWGLKILDNFGGLVYHGNLTCH